MHHGDCAAFRRALEVLYEEQSRAANITTGDKSFVLNVIVSDEAFGNHWLEASDYEAIRDAVSDDWEGA